jgi:hypothetical protein
MDYYRKYLKYKNKYLHLKQIAGSLTFVPINKSSKLKYALVKRINTDKAQPSSYKFMKPSDNITQPEIFFHNQRDIIDIFMTHIVPNLILNGKILTDSENDSSNVLGVGNYGVAIVTSNLVIKILKIFNIEDTISYLELSTNEKATKDIFNKLNNASYNEVKTMLIFNYPTGHPNICKLYSIFATKYDLLMEIIHSISEVKHKDDMIQYMKRIEPFYLFNFDTASLHVDDGLTFRSSNVLEKYKNTDDLLFVIMEKGDGDINMYYKQYKQYDHETKLTLMLKVFIDIYQGIKFMNLEKHYLHSDLKFANVIFKNSSSLLPNFKIIDFGCTIKLNLPKTIPFTIGKPFSPIQFYESTMLFSNVLDQQRIFCLFDLHCIACILLELLGQVKIEEDPHDTKIQRYMFSKLAHLINLKHEKKELKNIPLFSLFEPEILFYVYGLYESQMNLFQEKLTEKNHFDILVLCNIILILLQIRILCQKYFEKAQIELFIINPHYFDITRCSKELIDINTLFIKEVIDQRDILMSFYTLIDKNIIVNIHI